VFASPICARVSIVFWTSHWIDVFPLIGGLISVIRLSELFRVRLFTLPVLVSAFYDRFFPAAAFPVSRSLFEIVFCLGIRSPVFSGVVKPVFPGFHLALAADTFPLLF